MADADANRLVETDKILKDINNNNVDDDDSKANIILEEEVNSGEIQEAAQNSNEPASKTEVVLGNEDQPDGDDLKDEMSTCSDVTEMNYDKEAMEDLISKLHINGDRLPPTIPVLNNLRCRGRSTLLLFYRLWRDHLVKRPPPPPPPPL